MWVNSGGEKFWVEYHFKTDQGIEYPTRADADRLAGVDGDYHRRDLFDSIKKGDFPSWTLKMQIMRFEDAERPIDSTRSISRRSGRTRLSADRGR